METLLYFFKNRTLGYVVNKNYIGYQMHCFVLDIFYGCLMFIQCLCAPCQNVWEPLAQIVKIPFVTYVPIYCIFLSKTGIYVKRDHPIVQ